MTVIDAKVVELTAASRAVITNRGDVTLISSGQAMTLRKREIDRLIAAYTRAGHTTTNGTKA